MDSRCGCPDADTCWSACRCLTPSQKLAWAEANGVEPPDEVLLAARVERARATEPTCGVRASCSCCTAAALPVETDCCDATETTLADDDSASFPEGLRLTAVRRCGGLPWLWSVLDRSSIADELPLPVFVSLAGDWVRVRSERVPVRSGDPPVPPPRLVASV
ncbi:MAG TPA: hypothetical protein PLI18_01490 [Pirellulaceae bacterium]|nr:hypothetical protein [Pirellulaceae bacterium]